jgi:hypothetical protein
MRLSPKESRMGLLNATNLDRKSGIRGPKTMGEAQPQFLVADSPRNELAIMHICSMEVERESVCDCYPGLYTCLAPMRRMRGADEVLCVCPASSHDPRKRF